MVYVMCLGILVNARVAIKERLYCAEKGLKKDSLIEVISFKRQKVRVSRGIYGS